MIIEKCIEHVLVENTVYNWDDVVYPKVGKFCDASVTFLVLFFAPKQGVMIKEAGKPSGNILGNFSTTWCMSCFKPIDYTVTVTLTI